MDGGESLMSIERFSPELWLFSVELSKAKSSRESSGLLSTDVCTALVVTFFSVRSVHCLVHALLHVVAANTLPF